MQNNKIPIVIDQIYLGSPIQKKKKKTQQQQQLYFEKTEPLSGESFTGYISIPMPTDYNDEKM